MPNEKIVVRIEASVRDLFERLWENRDCWVEWRTEWQTFNGGQHMWINPNFSATSDEKCPRCKAELKKGGVHGPKDTDYADKIICGQCELELLQEKRNHELKVKRGEIKPEPEED